MTPTFIDNSSSNTLLQASTPTPTTNTMTFLEACQQILHGFSSIITLSYGDSYDFFNNTKGAFWANNIPQRGLIDIGKDPTGEEFPVDGYSAFGVQAVVNHHYIALGDDHGMGILRFLRC